MACRPVMQTVAIRSNFWTKIMEIFMSRFLKDQNVVINEFANELFKELQMDIGRFVSEMSNAYDLDYTNDCQNIGDNIRNQIKMMIESAE